MHICIHTYVSAGTWQIKLQRDCWQKRLSVCQKRLSVCQKRLSACQKRPTNTPAGTWQIKLQRDCWQAQQHWVARHLSLGIFLAEDGIWIDVKPLLQEFGLNLRSKCAHSHLQTQIWNEIISFPQNPCSDCSDWTSEANATCEYVKYKALFLFQRD